MVGGGGQGKAAGSGATAATPAAAEDVTALARSVRGRVAETAAAHALEDALAAFVGELTLQVSAIGRALAEDDAGAMARVAEGLAATASRLDAVGLADAGLSLQGLARAGMLDAVPGAIDRVRREVARAQRAAALLLEESLAEGRARPSAELDRGD